MRLRSDTNARTGKGRTARRAVRGVTAVLLASGLALTAAACGAGSDRSAADRSEGGRSHDGAPAPVAPDGGQGYEDRDDARRDEASGDEEPGEKARKPAPDYLSTFALDVDTASYHYTRRLLREGGTPEPRQVRPEEFVNSFRQDYRRPDGDGFSVTVDGARPGAVAGGAQEGEITTSSDRSSEGSSGGSSDRGETDAGDWSLVRVGLATAAAEDTGKRPPAALTFVIDTSGSMAEPGRLDLVKTSLSTLTDQLRDDDSIAVVTFSGEAETRLPMTRLDGNRDRIHDIVDDLEPGASTNVEAGVTTGYDAAVEGRRKGATNRVVLLSDALANTGATEADTILERIDDARREHGITLFGVGVGSDYGDELMERLADKGDGHTTYVSTTEDAREVFVDQLPAHVELRARDAKAQVAFDPATVRQFRLIGYENRAVADDDFRDDAVDGGEVGPGHTVTALYAVRLREGARGHVATATVRWLDPKTRAPHEASGSVETGAVDGPLWGEAPSRLQITAVAAYFAESLRGGGLPGDPGLAALERRARSLAESTEDDAVTGLADAIAQAARRTLD
ncbi:von Willebrand factor type A domain-containing protein [Streptomyces zhihengii]|uniref:YfbK domain-containing protein n=1 Tax=Streptomyces zhihengii TaxID=1818004 RepID=UPI003455A482